MTTWQERVKLAPHYLAIGQTEAYIGDWNEVPEDAPWDLVDRCQKGSGSLFWFGEQKVEAPTSVHFYAPHSCGLTFQWTIEISDSSGGINLERVEQVLDRAFSPEVRREFRALVRECAEAMRHQAVWYRDVNEKLVEAADEALSLVR